LGSAAGLIALPVAVSLLRYFAQQKKLNFQFSSEAEESASETSRGIFRLPLYPIAIVGGCGQGILQCHKPSTILAKGLPQLPELNQNILDSRFINTIDNITKENTGLIAQAEAAEKG
jgi:hypothetical protein